MNLTGNEAVSYNVGGLTIGENVVGLTVGDNLQGQAGGNYIGDDPFYHNYYYPNWSTWYPSTIMVAQPSKIEQGFKIVGKLLESKIITKDLTIKEFTKLVNDIAEIL